MTANFGANSNKYSYAYVVICIVCLIVLGISQLEGGSLETYSHYHCDFNCSF